MQNHGYAIKYTSKELKEDTQFLIECYRKNTDTIKYSDFIDKFDKLEKEEYDDDFIEENVNILHLLENKEKLYQYLLENEKYDIIYHNDNIAVYIRDNHNIIILSFSEIKPVKDNTDEIIEEKIKEEFRSKLKIKYTKLKEVIFID